MVISHLGYYGLNLNPLMESDFSVIFKKSKTQYMCVWNTYMYLYVYIVKYIHMHICIIYILLFLQLITEVKKKLF